MSYAQNTGNPRFDMARNLAGRRRDIGTPAIIDLTWNVPFRGLGAGPNGTDLVPQPYGLAHIYNRRTPYSIQYLLNVQRELGGNTELEIGYIGSVSRRLESLRAFNEVYPTADPTLSVASRSVKGGGFSVMVALPMPLSEAGNLEPFSPSGAVSPQGGFALLGNSCEMNSFVQDCGHGQDFPV